MSDYYNNNNVHTLLTCYGLFQIRNKWFYYTNIHT